MPFGQQLVGDRVLEATDRLECCKSIYVAVAPGRVGEHTFTTEHPLHLVSQGETGTDSMMNAVWEAQRRGDYASGDQLLVMTGDLPLLSPSALERFLGACQEAEEADLYIGMVPLAAVPEALHGAYQKDLLPCRGGRYLHSEVYLVRPDSVTEAGRKRFEEIKRIRRTNLSRPGDLLRAGAVLLRMAGVGALFPFVRIVVGIRRGGRDRQERARSALDGVERITLDLIRQRFGPKASLVTVNAPGLALEFDNRDQLDTLVEYDLRNGPLAE